eukprot:Anaeramoba_ignava/c17382_g1_i1.p2 GENE.c17382_g1_i1~~c17382_g1_i1.p2  ORF type:complete len:153 (-),score=11.47 c17382_g1_i1:404-862(-)
MDNRNNGLRKYVYETKDDNDKTILSGLEELEKKGSKYKATVAGLLIAIKEKQNKTISKGTVNNRTWAIAKLKSIKLKRQNKTLENNTDNISKSSQNLETRLRRRIKRMQIQNTILFQENLHLNEVVNRQKTELSVLSNKISRYEDKKISKLK